jgi:ribosomal-protein-alanine N-acetyltransferase
MELETARLTLRRFTPDDAPFALELVSQPSFIANIGDRGVRDLATAQRYLNEGPLASYAQHGFGLWHVARKSDGAPVGMCGLLRRETLPDADIGYAFLPQYWSQGFAFESAAAVLAQAAPRYSLARVLAVVSPHNAASIRLIEKLGMRFEGMHPWDGERDVRLYSCAVSESAGPPKS